MSPAIAHSKSLPTRPKFICDIRSVPRTDAKESQEGYADYVGEWCDYHDFLEDGNSNKVPKGLRGTLLVSQVYCRSNLIGKKIPKDKLQSEDGAATVVSSTHNRNALSVCNLVYTYFNSVMGYLRAINETFRNYKALF